MFQGFFCIKEVYLDNITYSTPEEQIEKLKGQHLIIENENFAIRALSSYGYSNLIKSYREPYMIFMDGKKVYRSGVTFEQLNSLYLLDKNLRNAVIASMLDLEEHIKEAAADVVAKSFGTHPDKYLNYRNYANKRKSKPRFSLSGILKTMNDTLLTDKNPIHHYQEEHGVVPPWILFKSIYFSTIVNFIDQFKTNEKNEMVRKLYNLQNFAIPEDALRFLMMDTLYICLEYRNIAAHGGRTYNYQCKYNLREAEIFQSTTENSLKGFSQLLLLLNLLNYQAPFIYLRDVLDDQVNRHCKKYPQDITYLAQILNMDIEQHEYVWISNSSNKYHTNPHCSGITNTQKVEKADIIQKGYIPCKRCSK